MFISNPILKFKGTYRVLPEIDLSINDFPRRFDGSIEDIDAYIPCKYGSKIMHYGHLDGKRTVWYRAYIPSIIRGRNIAKKLDEHHIEYRQYCENDEEVDFLFKQTDMDVVTQLLKAKTIGKDTACYSIKNLPKSDYNIPQKEINEYKVISARVEKSDLLILSQITNGFLYDIIAKKYRRIEVKSDIRKKCMSRQIKEYIHSMGEWENYLKYLSDEIDKFYIEKGVN